LAAAPNDCAPRISPRTSDRCLFEEGRFGTCIHRRDGARLFSLVLVFSASLSPHLPRTFFFRQYLQMLRPVRREYTVRVRVRVRVRAAMARSTYVSPYLRIYTIDSPSCNTYTIDAVPPYFVPLPRGLGGCAPRPCRSMQPSMPRHLTH
jgi:hypothetical protein